MDWTRPPLDLTSDDVVTFPHIEADDRGGHTLAGAPLRLNGVAAEVLDLCDGTRTWGDVTAAIADRHDVPLLDVSSDLYAFLGGAEHRSLVHIRRSARARLMPRALVQGALQLARLEPRRWEARRYEATPSGVVRATAWACRLPITLALLVVPMMFLTLIGQHVPLGIAVLAALAPLLLVAFVGTTIAAHEGAHLLAMAPALRDRAAVLADNLQVVVSQPAEHGSADAARVVALVGPFAGLAVGGLAAAATQLVSVLPQGLALLPLGVGVAHLFSLAPWSLDGQTLWHPARSADVNA